MAGGSQRSDSLRSLIPPEPQLLDTCIIQNLDWVDQKLEESAIVSWDDGAVAALARRYGSELADDLLDLGTLYKEFEHRGGYPWLVCHHSLIEARRSKGIRLKRLENMNRFMSGFLGELSCDGYPGVAIGLLSPDNLNLVSPVLLKGAGLDRAEDMFLPDGPLSFLPDHGDRVIAGHAIFANVPAVLTTDRTTFWSHRQRLAEFGVRVMRPTELLSMYETYWAALEKTAGGSHSDA